MTRFVNFEPLQSIPPNTRGGGSLYPVYTLSGQEVEPQLLTSSLTKEAHLKSLEALKRRPWAMNPKNNLKIIMVPKRSSTLTRRKSSWMRMRSKGQYDPHIFLSQSPTIIFL